MVTILEIRHDRSFACIVLENREQFWISQEDLPSSGFFEGAELTREEFLSMIRILQYPRALNLAVAMLARRSCSKGEILSRLRIRRVSEEVAGLVLYKLEKENLVNDEAFSREWIKFRLTRGYGPALIRRELRMKGVSPEIIDTAMSETDPDDENEKAAEAARRIWKKNDSVSNVSVKRQKVILSLVRKGFDWDTAKAACSAAEKEE